MSSAVPSGFFTLGVRPDWHLPHPRLGLPVILLIRRVLLRAFELLREQEYNLPAATEDQVTAARNCLPGPAPTGFLLKAGG
jgi:hypothetical protein